MAFDDAIGNGKTQSGAGRARPHCIGSPVEPFEYIRNLGRGNSNAGVLEDNSYFFVVSLKGNANFTIQISVTNGIVQYGQNNLANSDTITFNHRRMVICAEHKPN